MLGRLRPVGLSDLGLAHAIETLAAFWRRRCPDIAINIAVSPPLAEAGALDEGVENVVYRIVQESMSNAVRHGRPKTIDVSVDRDRDALNGLVVRIVDDGTGLGERPGRRGFGLIGMRERVTGMGGSLQVSNRAGGGSEVVARLAVAAAAVVRTPDDMAPMTASS
jgi:two-component system sensor histidine kinase UhpB